MATKEVGLLDVAEKLAQLVEQAPAGGLFHDARIMEVAGVEVPGFGGSAGFTIQLPGGKFNVTVQSGGRR